MRKAHLTKGLVVALATAAIALLATAGPALASYGCGGGC
jgi:hypothetical protein